MVTTEEVGVEKTKVTATTSIIKAVVAAEAGAAVEDAAAAEGADDITTTTTRGKTSGQRNNHMHHNRHMIHKHRPNHQPTLQRLQHQPTNHNQEDAAGAVSAVGNTKNTHHWFSENNVTVTNGVRRVIWAPLVIAPYGL